MKQIFLAIAWIAILSATSVAQNGYEIRLKIKELKNQPIILGHYFASNKNTLVDDTVMLNANGEGVFKDSKKLTGGMYFLYYTGHLYDLIVNDEQKFSIETDTLDFIGNAVITNSLDNKLLFDYQKLRNKKFEQQRQIEEKMKTASEADKAKYQKELQAIGDEMKQAMDNIVNNNSQSFFARFLVAAQDVDIPDKFKDKGGKFIDSMYFDYMKYYEEHYFDKFDYTDLKLLNTPIYDGKIQKYLEVIERQNSVEDLIPMVDKLIANSRKSPEMFRYMLITLHNYYAQSQLMCMDKVFVHIAKNYYITEATWSDAEYINKLKGDVKRKQNIFCFDKTPELKMTALPQNVVDIEALRAKLKVTRQMGMDKKTAYDAKKKAGTATAQDSTKLNNDYFYTFQQFEQNIEEYVSLHQVDANYTLLWFWEPSCSHCSKATPMLSEFYQKLNKNSFQVYAVFIQSFIVDWDKYTRNIDEWFEFVIKNKMTGMVNAWDVHHESQFRDFYDISGTPVAFLLDKDKKIIAKRMGIVQSEDILIERLMRDMKEKHPDTKDLLKQLNTFITDQFTLREIDALNYALPRVFRADQGEKVKELINAREVLIKARFDAKIKDLCKVADDKLRIKGLEEYADSFYNSNDLNYIKEVAGKLLNAPDKEKFDKFVDERVKYKLEE